MGLQSFRFGFESEGLIAESLPVELIGAGSRILFVERLHANFFLDDFGYDTCQVCSWRFLKTL